MKMKDKFKSNFKRLGLKQIPVKPLNSSTKSLTFYDTFIKEVLTESQEKNKYLKIKKFREFLIEEVGLNYETIKLCSEGMKYYMNKPQRCLYNYKNYYVGVDMNTNMYYMCIKGLLMIDIDTRTKSLNDIKEMCLQHSEDSFFIYKSMNGYHVYVTNRMFDNVSQESIEYIISFGADVNYIICYYVRGSSIRLNKKSDRESDNLYTFLDSVGNQNSPDIIDLIKKQDTYIQEFKKEFVYLLN